MQAFYPLLTVISMTVFVWLGRRLAVARSRNAWGWALAGALLPPLLIILYALKPLEASEDDAEA
ncbi:MAG: hypothetical protein AB7E79_07925 [Rhodospirillaceae bacterium]